MNMSRRPVNAARRLVEGGSIPFASALHPKSRSSSYLSVLLILGGLLVIAYIYSGTGRNANDREALSKAEGGVSCTFEVQKALPLLKKAYGDSMHKVLHIGPDTCSVVSKLLKEEDTEAWGVEPYDLDDADANCKRLVRKGIVRVADIKFSLPYRSKSFNIVIVSDALDYLSPRYLNRTLPELVRVSADGVVIFAGYPGQHRAKLAELSKFGRPTFWEFNSDPTSIFFVKAKLRSSSWWIRFFVQTNLEENETAAKKFEQASIKRSYKPACQVFHLNAYH
ncbi:Methionine biosynthesis MetW [Dillenia turbinata]|uniref:Methionine biosynthesis MetW n=1 Tax=Dillenia turbinata TaxID=194707 RepID=A0AAN8WH54_9MAGN